MHVSSSSIQAGANLVNDHECIVQNVPIFAQLGVSTMGPDRQTIANSIVNQYNLNGEQWQAYVLVTWHAIADRPTLLRLYIGGCGGTGQTQVILALNEFFRQIDHS